MLKYFCDSSQEAVDFLIKNEWLHEAKKCEQSSYLFSKQSILTINIKRKVSELVPSLFSIIFTEFSETKHTFKAL